MADERRQHRRVPALFDIIWQGAAGRQQARTSDLSAGGCFIDSIAQVAVGEELALKLRLPSGGWLELRGVVMYQFPNVGFGVLFTGASEADWKRLEWLIKAEGLKSR